jgi:predicted Fe-Mo cluster-binding NifX family protein
MLIDPESMAFTIEANPAQQAPGGAGIQAAQWVLDQGAGVVISGNLGPKAFNVLAAGKVAAYKHEGGSVRAVMDAYQQKTLECLLSPSAEAHSGMD